MPYDERRKPAPPPIPNESRFVRGRPLPSKEAGRNIKQLRMRFPGAA